MDRKERREPEWGADEERELLADAEVAERFGFHREDITAARHDLEMFSWTFHNNPFEIYEKSSKSIGKIAEQLSALRIDLARVRLDTNSQATHELIEQLESTETQLRYIQARLPRRPRALPNIVATYLLAFWTHVDRVATYSGPRDVKSSFDGEKPIHPSMEFVFVIRSRSMDPVVRSLSQSTVKRAVAEYKNNRIKPNEIFAFTGDPKLLND